MRPALAIAAGTGLLLAAAPAGAQNNDSLEYETRIELKRASAPARAYCEQRNAFRKTRMDEANEAVGASDAFTARIGASGADALKVEQESLERRIRMSRMRGDSPGDMSSNALGDLLLQLEQVKRARAGDRPTPDDDKFASFREDQKRYFEAMLSCLDARDRFPEREWRDPTPGAYNPATPVEKDAPGWEVLPDAPVAGASWAGRYSDGANVYIVSGFGDSLTAMGKSNDGRASGSWSQCKVSGNQARCVFAGNYRDGDKDAAYTGKAELTLDAGAISGTHHLEGVRVTWKPGVTPYGTAFHDGASFPFRLVKDKK